VKPKSGRTKVLKALSPCATEKDLVGSFFQDAGDIADGIHKHVDSWIRSDAAPNAKNAVADGRPRAGTFAAWHGNELRAGTSIASLFGATGLRFLKS